MYASSVLNVITIRTIDGVNAITLACQAFFTQIQTKQSKAGEMLLTSGNPVTKHPRTGEPISAYALGTEMPEQSPEEIAV